MADPTSFHSTAAAAIETQTESVNGDKKEKRDKPIYEQFRAEKNQSNSLSRLRNIGNECFRIVGDKCFRIGKRSSDNGAGENGPELDPAGNASAEKNESSQPGNIYGFDYEMLWLVRLLVKPAEKEEEDFKRIGIVGMPAVGKSDIGRLIFNNESVKQHFAPRIWVPMSGKSTEVVVKDILKQLDVSEELIKQWTEGGAGAQAVDALLYALNLKLIGKRYLIILDNVDEWKKGDLDPFKFGFPKGSGGAVVVTSRKKSVVMEMVERDENVYVPQPIKNADSCWDIYNTVLEGRKIEHPTEELKNEFKKKIGGLPVAAKLMGEIKMSTIRSEKEKKPEIRNGGPHGLGNDQRQNVVAN